MTVTDIPPEPDVDLPPYWAEIDPRQLLRDYPIGEAFLDGPAQWPAETLRAAQERRFQRVVARAWSVPFYERRWRAAGLEPFDIQTLDDLTKIPPFTKADLMASIAEHPPWGDYHGLDHNHPHSVFHAAKGGDGVLRPLFFGPKDREVKNLLLARALLLQGLGNGDVVHSAYGFGLDDGGHYVREAVTHFTGALLMPAGSDNDGDSEQQLAFIRRFGATVIVGRGRDLDRLTAAAHSQAGDLEGQTKVRMIAGHLDEAETAALSAAWGGIPAFGWFGGAETGIIAAEGLAHQGLHLWEDAHLVEVLDPETGKPLPDGAPGRLCTTALFKDGVFPVIRFNTQDRKTLLPPAGGIGFRRLGPG